MKLDAAAYHEIINLTSNVAVSPAEAETWKKCLLVTADEKIKLQKSQLTANLLRKLKKTWVGGQFGGMFCEEKLWGRAEERGEEEENCPAADER